MPVCQFFLRGMCRYGSNCRNEHVAPRDLKGGKDASNLVGPENFGTISKTVQDDLVKEKPAFYLSVYAPCKNAPNMIDGTDVSPEELRFNAYQARASNTMPQYIANEAQQIQQMDAVISSITKNTHDAYKHFYHTRVPLNHPTSTFGQASAPAFSAQSGSNFTQATAFGKPAFGVPQSGGFGAFGTSAPATSSAPAFGQSPNRPAVTAFGAPSTVFGASTFGAPPPATSSTATAFGQPSAFGAPAAVSAFGAAPATTAFGNQPTSTAFGTQPVTTAFGTQPAATAFGAQPPVSVFGAPSKFGTTAFGGAPTQSSIVSAFGVPSAFGVSAAPTGKPPVSAFGQSQSTTSSFGQSTAFGKPSAFGQSAFGKPSAFGSTSTPSAFGQPAFGQSAFGSNANASTLSTTTTTTAAAPPPLPQPTGGFAAFANSGSGGVSFTPAPPTTPAPSSSAFGTKAVSAFSTVSAFGAPNASQPAISTVGSSRTAEPPNQTDPWWEDAPKESELPPDLLAAFQAEWFSWDLIPHLPPPISLR
ncbi:hypothetical protein CROQUDRAFT_75220 [Cronartium quercuum f. sp. fusiforme G11]|uniref:C3H1-type domain-containing protein n=1 Tax=Cronartium quercuum f. sp. fusiforme G11 TaxID=708437 RepID=A0A9P6NQV0_9BASI|nr:hypothetical protein CROQUDRAFT_75220 [Cronartium quercuum f. sp. fusiforme G11]